MQIQHLNGCVLALIAGVATSIALKIKMASDAESPLPTSAVLMSIAKHIAINCKSENTAFMECKLGDRNPEACLAQGEAVTKCTIAL